MAFRLIYFLLITLGCLTTDLAAAKDKCNKRQLNHIADCQSMFLLCTVSKSVPANSCTDCYHQYKNMSIVYEAFVANCSEQYLNKNHLNIVYNTQKTLVEMWNVAFCDDCFDDNGYPSNSTETFRELTGSFDNCVHFNITAACQKCPGKYIALNDFYKKMEDQKNGKICFDIQDKMNTTRLLWSKELKCCHRELNLTLFLVGSSIFGVLPLLFYVGMYAYTKRLERNHQVIDSSFNSENQVAAASTSGGISSGSLARNDSNEPLPSTSTIGIDDMEDIKKPKVNLAAKKQQELSSTPTGSESLINL